MAVTTVYHPKNGKPPFPVIIGLPGLLHQSEKSRCDSILEKTSNNGICGIRVTYSGITLEESPKGKIIRCEFNMDRLVNDIHEVLQRVEKNPLLDEKRVGIFASSMSAGIMGYFLPNNNFPLKAYASVSPLVSWEAYGTECTRNLIINTNTDIPITSVADKERKIFRYIPKSCIPAITQMNSLRTLGNYSRNGLEVITIIGNNDTTANPKAMREYHEALGGMDLNIKTFNEGHDIPTHIYQEEVIRFFLNKLS